MLAPMVSDDTTSETWAPSPGDHFLTAPSYLEATYDGYIYTDSDASEGSGTTLYLHPNGVGVVALRPPHPALSALPPASLSHAQVVPSEADNNLSASLTFRMEGGSLLDAQLRKGRGPAVQQGQPLCTLSASGQEWILRSPVGGFLIEANGALENMKDRELLR